MPEKGGVGLLAQQHQEVKAAETPRKSHRWQARPRSVALWAEMVAVAVTVKPGPRVWLCPLPDHGTAAEGKETVEPGEGTAPTD